jgi:hypothetical protein
MRKILEVCPSCGGPLAVTGLNCTRCETGISGRFRPCDFCRLSEEQSTFLRLFVQRRGNLSSMEEALGISYPTVRNKLEEIIKLLDTPSAPDPAPAGGREAILRQVAGGALSAEEALTRLRSLNREEK